MMPMVLMGSVWLTLFGLVLFLTAVFLVLLILIQRGRGGGLSGAFGGMGGQSAFGSKAGDTFTFITIVVATFWITLCIAGVGFMAHYSVTGGKFSRVRDVGLEEAPETPVLMGEATKEPEGSDAASPTAAPGSATEKESSRPPADAAEDSGSAE